jgi:hypothetical protein
MNKKEKFLPYFYGKTCFLKALRAPYMEKDSYFCNVIARIPYSNKAKVSKVCYEDKVPNIFLKRINVDKVKTIPLNLPNSVGFAPYYPSATKEWTSSIYAHYNNNHIKSLPVLDKNVVKLLKSYFNFYHISENWKERRITRFRRTSLNQVFISKAELKHTNSKVIINIDVYNLQKRVIINEIKSNLYFNFFFKDINLIIAKLGIIRKAIDIERRKEIKLYTFLKKLKKILFILIGNKLSRLIIKELNNLSYNKLKKLINKKLNLPKGLKKIILRCIRYNTLRNEKLKTLIIEKLELERKLANMPSFVMYYFNLCHLYCLKKWNAEYLSKLVKLIRIIYKKEVEINIVDLKYMYLNSYILTQAIALKLKDRDNRVWRVLRSCLGMVKIPYNNKFKEKSKGYKGQSLVDKIKKLNIDSITSCIYNSNAKQNNSYLGIFSTISGKQGWSFFVKNCLRNKVVNGVRLQATGRLTRRFKAQRAILKLTWKGGLKNIDSSYKGFSAVILRGHVKSNVQYTFAKSKNRIGAYGVKGWVSGK